MDPRKSRGTTARSLYQKSNREIVDQIIREQIRAIDSAIEVAHSSGFSHIEYELPVNFSINNLDKMDAQTLIYSEIILKYKDPESNGGKGFTKTFIDLGPPRVMLHIHWLNGMDAEERKRRREIIASSLMPSGKK